MKVMVLRKAKGLTQTELARLCETTQQQIAKIEMGTVDPKLSTLMKIADALKVEIKDLFYTKKEFEKEINQFILREELDKKRIALLTLNSLAYEYLKIPKFHPFWEKVKIENNHLVFMEENNV